MMEVMRKADRIGISVLGALVTVLLLGVSDATADRLTSPNYQIDSNLDGSFGGTTGSSSYKMTATGGESIVGNGASGSYMLDRRVVGTGVESMQLAVQPTGLVAFYPLDGDISNVAPDASRYQNNGTFNDRASWYPGGKIGNAVDMNGATDSTSTSAVLIPDNTNLPSGSTMTVEAWVRQSAWYSNQAIASHWNYPSSASWALQTGTNNNLRVFIADSQSELGNNYVDTSIGTWNSFNTWRHVTMVYDGTQSQANKVKVYIDGVLAGSTVVGTLPSTLQNSSGPFSIGSFPGLGRALTGAIDHVKLFNRALTQAEVSAEYTAQNAGISTGLNLDTAPVGSTTSNVEAVVKTNVAAYNLAVQQDHDLQNGAKFIPAVGGSIATPQTWSEGVTEGFGFTLTGAPEFDSKWNSGAKYAALPSSSTTFYSGTGQAGGVVDVINVQLRVDLPTNLAQGTYTNALTYTGTALP
jgi:hypothetical protein